jgi:hypothetical protein
VGARAVGQCPKRGSIAAGTSHRKGSRAERHGRRCYGEAAPTSAAGRRGKRATTAMPSYSLVTYGCQMNEHDSARMREVLAEAAYHPAPALEAADLILLNTCAVREKAEQKLRSQVGRLARLKGRAARNAHRVAGCVAQRRASALAALPHVIWSVAPDQHPRAPRTGRELRGRAVHLGRGRSSTLEAPHFLRARPLPGRQGPTAQVTVMKGATSGARSASSRGRGAPCAIARRGRFGAEVARGSRPGLGRSRSSGRR